MSNQALGYGAGSGATFLNDIFETVRKKKRSDLTPIFINAYFHASEGEQDLGLRYLEACNFVPSTSSYEARFQSEIPGGFNKFELKVRLDQSSLLVASLLFHSSEGERYLTACNFGSIRPKAYEARFQDKSESNWTTFVPNINPNNTVSLYFPSEFGAAYLVVSDYVGSYRAQFECYEPDHCGGWGEFYVEKAE